MEGRVATPEARRRFAQEIKEGLRVQARIYYANHFLEYKVRPPSPAHAEAVSTYSGSEVTKTNALVSIAEEGWSHISGLLAENNISTPELANLRQDNPELYAKIIGCFAGSLIGTRLEGFVDGVVANQTAEKE